MKLNYWVACFKELFRDELILKADSIVVAETKDDALDIVLKKYPSSGKDIWIIEEIELPDKPGIVILPSD